MFVHEQQDLDQPNEQSVTKLIQPRRAVALTLRVLSGTAVDISPGIPCRQCVTMSRCALQSQGMDLDRA